MEASEQQIRYEVARAGRDFLLFRRTASDRVTNPVLHVCEGEVWRVSVSVHEEQSNVCRRDLHFVRLFQDSETNDTYTSRKKIRLKGMNVLTCRESPTAVRNKRNPNFLMTKHEHSNKRRKESTL